MGFIVMAAMVFCLAAGGYVGWIIGRDQADKRADDEMAARFAAVPEPGRHRQAAPRLLPAAPKAAAPSTAAMFAALEAEVSAPTVAMQPPIGQLVAPARQHRPGRATDFITALERDTDRFIAQMGRTANGQV